MLGRYTTRLPMPYRTFQHAVRRGEAEASVNNLTPSVLTPAFISSLTRRCARDPWIVRIPRCAGEQIMSCELQHGERELGLKTWRTVGSMELFHASVSALLFGATTPQDEGGQRCISRQKIKNAGVGLSAQTVDTTDGHGTKSRRESWANPHLTLTNSSLMPSQSPPGPPCASKHASPGRIYLSSTSLDLTEARRSRAGEFPNHIA